MQRLPRIYRLFLLALIVALSGCGSDPDPADATVPLDRSVNARDAGLDAEADALPSDGSADQSVPSTGLYPLQGIQLGLPTTDLEPFKIIVGSAEYLALGESVHTSGGFYQTKARLIAFLVEELNFRAFAIESPWKDAEAVGDFLAACTAGDRPLSEGVDAINKGLFGVWAGKALGELVSWLCTFNAAHPGDPVIFFGFDVQQPWNDMNLLELFVPQITADSELFLAPLIEHCHGTKFNSATEYYLANEDDPVSAAERDACLLAVEALRTLFAQQESEIINKTSLDELRWAKIALGGIESWEQTMFYMDAVWTLENFAKSFEARDVAMAFNVQEIRDLRAAGARTVIWAHNTHIAANQDKIIGAQYEGARSMGTFLKVDLQHNYLPIGLIGYDVEINWPSLHTGPTTLPTTPHSVEVLLHAEQHPTLLVDLEFPGVEQPIFEPNRAYQVNRPVFDMDPLYETMVPAEQFRALIYLEHSAGMQILPY